VVESLDYMPFRRRVFDKEPWKSQEVRLITADNYNIYYKPNEEDNTVKIIRIMHGMVNAEKHLPIEN